MENANTLGVDPAKGVLQGKPWSTQFYVMAHLKHRITLKQISVVNWICSYPNKAPRLVQGLEGISKYAREIEAEEIKEDLRNV